MTAYLPRRAVVALAAALVVLSQTGTRCGDAYRVDPRTATVVTR